MEYDEFLKTFIPEKDAIYIYALCKPNDDNYIRYVGKSKVIISRIKKHLETSRIGNSEAHKNNWLRQIKKDELKPNVIIIEKCNIDNWAERETYWIAYYRELFPDLTNLAKGGEGGGRKLYQREIDAIIKRNTGKKFSPETIQKLIDSHAGKYFQKKQKKICLSLKIIDIRIEQKSRF